MGSFNVACSISGISLNSGEKIVFIPLEAAKYSHNRTADGSCFLLYPNCFYVPASFPLIGEYGDYGYIEKIETTAAVEFISKWYEVEPEHLCISKDNAPKNIISGMYIIKEAYDLMINDGVDEEGMKSDFAPNRKHVERTLREFVKQYLDIDEIFVESGKLDVAESFKRLQIGNLPFFREHITMQKVFERIMDEGTIDKLFEDLVSMAMFEYSMYDLNKFYFPAMNGSQFGNPYMVRRLANVTKSALKRILKNLTLNRRS